MNSTSAVALVFCSHEALVLVPMEPIPDIARATASRYEMFPAGCSVLAMVSGGADSVALLELLATGELRDAAGEPFALPRAEAVDDVTAGSPARLRVLHVDHMLRGEESDADAEFVRALCDEMGVPCEVVSVDVAAYAEQHGLNLEDAGRRIRYSLADTHLTRLGAHARAAVAHTRDDRIETSLMRLAQGAGTTGLVSMRPVRGRIVRPLADCSREGVRAWLRARGRPWREDATNADTARVRARVRAELLPLLRAMNPRFDEAMARTLALLGDEDDLLAEMGAAFARDFTEVLTEPGAGPGESHVELAVEPDMFSTLSRPMQRRALRAALSSAFPEATRLEFEHLEAVLDGLGDPAFARDLPDGLRAESRYGRLYVSRAGEAPEPLAPRLLEIPGTLDLGPAGRIEAELVSPRFVSEARDTVVIAADAIGGELTVGSVVAGDRMRPLGMEGSKKLSDMLVDAKVPKRERAITPVVRDGERIVWLAGVRMSEEYKVTPETTRAIRLVWTRTK